MLPIGTMILLLLLGAQRPTPPSPPEEKSDVLLPSGKSQRREILKADFEKSKSDAAELAELAAELKEDLEKKDYQVLDLRTMKKAEEIEKLARRIKDRMKRHF
ncbi:MAG: hypothetical protein HY238_02630 [Acidobacteria bacterium]|nr:hypothetical protein [Acidobacteriota bacterium]